MQIKERMQEERDNMIYHPYRHMSADSVAWLVRLMQLDSSLTAWNALTQLIVFLRR